jgi:hypothetical protein
MHLHTPDEQYCHAATLHFARVRMKVSFSPSTSNDMRLLTDTIESVGW